MKKKVLIWFGFSLFLIIFILIGIYNFFIPPVIEDIDTSESMTYNDQVIVNIGIKDYFFRFNKDSWCLLSNDENVSKNDNRFVKSMNGYCSFTVPSGEYNIFVKDKYGNIGKVEKQKIQLNKVIGINTNKNVFYMYMGMEEKIEYDVESIGDVSKDITIKSSDENIVSVEDFVLKAVGYGKADVILEAEDGTKKRINIVVSNFISKPEIKESKPYVSCGQFSKEDNQLIDKILEDRVNSAGIKTRGAVLAAARFLTLEFNYRIPYFYENGRIDNYSPYLKVDGEGRYYHKGLFLNESKYSELSNIFVGPATWGCKLQNYTDWGPYVTGEYYPNGLDCSGFVTWALYNAGYEPGDIGAGVDNNHKDLTDLGERIPLSNNLIYSGKVKVGDLIGLDGHAAIIVGIDNDNYYIAESLNTTRGVVVTTVRKDKLVNNSIYKYVVLMDSFYQKDGVYSNMF